MTEQEITERLAGAFPDGDITVALNGGHVDIVVTSAAFEGLETGGAPAGSICAAI